MTKREEVKFLQRLFDPQKGDLKKAGKKREVVFDREEIEEIWRFGNEPDLPDEGPSVFETDPIDPDLSTVKGVPNRDGTYSRVRRGGAYNDEPKFSRSAMRLRYEPERRSDHIGFRIVAVQA